MEQTQNDRIKSITLTGLFTAVLVVTSQLAIPLPVGVPVTLQTFGVALTGYFLGWKNGGLSVFIYALLGAVGVPVFANWTGGLNIVIGVTGGFIIGFIPMAMLCGAGSRMKSSVAVILIGISGLLIAHLWGVIQFSLLTGMGFVKSLLAASVPFLIKDIISVICAYILSSAVKRRVKHVFL